MKNDMTTDDEKNTQEASSSAAHGSETEDECEKQLGLIWKSMPERFRTNSVYYHGFKTGWRLAWIMSEKSQNGKLCNSPEAARSPGEEGSESR